MATGPVVDPPTILFSTAVAALPASKPARSPKSARRSPPTSPPPTAGESRLDERINAVLQGAIAGLGCTAAELRLVDDEATLVRTSHHQTAADWVFEPTVDTPLADAAGELAAMSGAAVVLEDARALADWEIDRSVGAAICVPVASDTTIHGALWFYCDQPMQVEQPQLQLAEIIAGRLAVEYERHWLLEQERYRQTTRRRSPLQGATSTGRRTVAAPTVPATESQPDHTAQHATVAGEVHDSAHALHIERRLTDGRMLLAAATVIDSPGLTAHEAAFVQQAVTDAINHGADEVADAGELLTDVGRHVWRNTTGGDAVSMAVAIVNDQTGEASIALAGDAAALSVKASRRQPITTDLPPIGWDEEAVYPSRRLDLSLRERLVLAIGDPRQTGEETADQMASGFKPATADEHRRMTADETLARASVASLVEGKPLLAVNVLRRG